MIALMSSLTVSDFVALIAEIEPEIFTGVSFLVVAKIAIERVIRFQLVPTITLGNGGLWNPMVDMLFHGFKLLHVARALDWRGEVRFRGSHGGRDGLAHLATPFWRRRGHCYSRTSGTERLRRLRVSLCGCGSRSTGFRGKRVRVEDMAASRTLEGRRIVGKHPLVNPVTGMTTSTLNFDHSPTSQPGRKIIIPRKTTHLPGFQAVRPSRAVALRCE